MATSNKSFALIKLNDLILLALVIIRLNKIIVLALSFKTAFSNNLSLSIFKKSEIVSLPDLARWVFNPLNIKTEKSSIELQISMVVFISLQYFAMFKANGINTDESTAVDNAIIMSWILAFSTLYEKIIEIVQTRAKEIKAIFCASGGANSNSTFEYLDYELIKNKRGIKNPPLCFAAN